MDVAVKRLGGPAAHGSHEVSWDAFTGGCLSGHSDPEEVSGVVNA